MKPPRDADARRTALLRLDHSFFALRRVMVKPPTAAVPIPALGRAVDVAKLIGCEAIDQLAAGSDPVTVKDVAAYLGLEPSTVSRLLTELEADGLVRRGAHPDDARRTTLELTDDGRHVVVGSEQVRQSFLQHMTEGWDAEDLERLSLLLARFAQDVHDRKAAWDPGFQHG
jgi:DNA-binding MarR family transcriptional regulator